MEKGKNYYTVKEAMELLGVNRDTIYRYIKNGTIESIKLGRDHYIVKESLDKKLAKIIK